jgi:penicillin-binding protein 1A
VYTVAIDQGYPPCYEVPDAPVYFELPGNQEQRVYAPQNFNRDFTGEKMTIRQGMARSKNSITAFMMKQVTPERVVKYAKEMGVESPLDAVPSLCLGTSDVSVYELVGAYSTFVNRGIFTKPYFITRIEDKYGNVLQEFPPETREALSEETAFLMLHMLMGATQERGGTALGLSREVREGNEVGAKTGTTQNASDGWFMGVTKDLVSGVWVGGDERSIHFRTSALGQGARMAMPIWDNYMQSVYADKSLDINKGMFSRPIRRLDVELDCDKYQMQGDGEAELDSLNNSSEKIEKEDIF